MALLDHVAAAVGVNSTPGHFIDPPLDHIWSEATEKTCMQNI